MKYDVKRREYDVVVIGEEAHLAYNRVGLTSYFEHRQVENLYLNPKEWVSMHGRCVPGSSDTRLVPRHAGRCSQLPSQHQSHRDQLG